MAGFGVIFDLDGVLVDTVEAHFHAWSTVACRLGIEFSRVDNDQLRGVPGPQSLKILTAGCPPLDPEMEAQLLEVKGQAYREYLRRSGRSIRVPGVERLLAAVRSLGPGIAVASASRHARMLLQSAGLLPFVDVVSDGYFAGRPKPEPDQLLTLGEQLGARPEDCIVVEDAPVGLEAARRAGMRTIGIGPVVSGDRRAAAHLPSLQEVTAEELLALGFGQRWDIFRFGRGDVCDRTGGGRDDHPDHEPGAREQRPAR